jgi:ribosomal protein S18 acetylase RimI-like enzyme
MEPEIMLATLADVERLLPHTELFWKFERIPFDLPRVRGLLSGLLENPSYGRVLLAQGGEDVLGYLVLTFGYSLEHGGRDALVDELYVREDARGSRLGTRLLDHAVVMCEREGITRLHLEVDNTNPRAEALYARLGFVSNDRRLLTKSL